MYRFRSGVVYATIMSALWLSACATNPPESETIELQRTAMQRWKACLARHTDTGKTPVSQISQLVDRNCEGHRRDIVALFPPQMANRVDQMLVASAYRYVDATVNTGTDGNQQQQVIRTLLR